MQAVDFWLRDPPGFEDVSFAWRGVSLACLEGPIARWAEGGALGPFPVGQIVGPSRAIGPVALLAQSRYKHDRSYAAICPVRHMWTYQAILGTSAPYAKMCSRV